MAEWLTALAALRGKRSYPGLDKAVNPAHPGQPVLSKSTLSNLLNKGRPSIETLELFLRACGVPREEWNRWQDARERVLSADLPVPPGLVRVYQAKPHRLGVHDAIDVPGATGEQPAYVQRDTDTDPRGVRGLIQRASKGGGLVLLVGRSSVGKTRCAFEAIRDLLPNWWLLHPDDADHVRTIAADPPDHVVVWLDELQHYLDGADGLRAGTVRALLERGAVLVGTMWSDRRAAYSAVPSAGSPDPHAHARQLLGLADVVHIAEHFSQPERHRAEQLATGGDARLAVAIRSEDYGLTQTIAAAPELVRRCRDAGVYAGAVLKAAVDVTRLGVASPLTAAMLRQAAPGYCEDRERAKAPPNWFETAMAYLTEELHGAASVLELIAAPGVAMGEVAGYLVADYVQQQVQAERRREKIPASCWQALVDHLVDPVEQTRVGVEADKRLLYRYASLLYRHAVGAGDGSASRRLAELLVEQGQVDEAIEVLRVRADTGDVFAAGRLVELLVEQGQVEELRVRAEAGHKYAALRLVELLVEQGQVEELRVRAEAGHVYAAERLADLLVERGQVEELRVRAEAGDGPAAERLADLLVEQGQVDEAIEVLQAPVEAGDALAALRLVELLVERGQVEELRVRAEAGHVFAARRFADLLIERKQVEELRVRAEAGDGPAAERLADLLVEQGQVDEAERIRRDGLEAD
ncbi:tetratricopeptide repeat protein [Nonomuraea sp. NPDC050663]|uniref:tetratricopeptide repeat protein n=1 Tax=Nonomuraea sp. NPDC050663 TaxID=3364370 RepID=UPI003792389E